MKTKKRKVEQAIISKSSMLLSCVDATGTGNFGSKWDRARQETKAEKKLAFTIT